ncbi:hypothetical protein NIES4101_65380 [Calothrix sp. NIES-4101]|nr:hypothetical protein NIES4101_65380 [Calothrix sp. NIES-4101]
MRKLFFVFPLLLVTFCGSIFSAVEALPSQEVETTYYSNASKTKVVGGSILSCYGGFKKWGKQTQYKTRFISPCD